MTGVHWEVGPYRMTVSLPETDAPWAVEGAKGLMGIRPMFEGRGPEPRPLPEVESAINPLLLGALGKGF